MRYTWIKYAVVIVAPKAGVLPVAVPGICLRRRRSLASADRGHSLGSLDTAAGGGRLVPQLRYTWIKYDICNALII